MASAQKRAARRSSCFAWLRCAAARDRREPRRGLRRGQTLAAGAVCGSGRKLAADRCSASVVVFGSGAEKVRCARRLRGGRRQESGGRDHAARVYRYDGGLQLVSDQRFRARCISHRRWEFRRSRSSGPPMRLPPGRWASWRASCGEPVECAPCMLRECPDRPSLHDARDGGTGGCSG